MKRSFSLLLLTLLAVNAVSAQTFVVDGIQYNITSVEDPYTVEVIGIQHWVGSLVIPSTIDFRGIHIV